MSTVTDKIKIICADKNISVKELAEGSGLTAEQVNRICESEKIPSLSSLIKISRALGVRLGTFLDDSEQIGPVVNRGEDKQQMVTFTSHQTNSNSHMDFTSLAASKAGRNMEPFLINIQTDNGNEARSSHEGEEFLFVLEGSIKVNYGNESYILKQGDSIYYDSIVDHLVTSIDENGAKILAVVYSPA
ncbi:MAG: cupin domain-containing protein [Fermentimonas sp.]|jgi:transcriptional regulator with XRE-family HTH domain|nr:cupin domain-containing protein [Fermentimonas sp.]MDD3511135.1 cupin domain-containing protein [Fermentimonas sp.]MDD4285138.1 cupin domain-containing protein [Fermentimonas sp.]MDD4724936.1 cupin domain-containing protein [Fermentimonas sp.]HBT85435.1 DNA-binding protein [Porphyromonadaceae bacterium]